MKRFEFAGPAMLLSAWLLMQAPKLQDPGDVAVDHSRATIKWWQQVHAFDSARDCEETRVKDVGLKEEATRCIPAYVIYP